MILKYIVGVLAVVSSPDKQLKVQISLVDDRPYYSVSYREKVMLENSPLGFVSNEGDFTTGIRSVGKAESVIDMDYTQDKIKRSRVHYAANRLSCSFENAQKRRFDIVFQVSDNDIAFRYELPVWAPRMACVVEKEATGFRFPSGTTTFLSPMMNPMTGFARTAPSYESMYAADVAMDTANFKSGGFVFPGLFKVGKDGWVLLSETGVSSLYCASHLGDCRDDRTYTIDYPDQGQNNGFGSTGAAIALPGVTPWRTITIGETLKPIVETTIPFDVVEPLYEPSQVYHYGRATWSWIVWQDQSMNYDDQVKYIDLAAAMGYEYILMDALWDKNIGKERMAELARYAGSKNISVFLWYNSNGPENDAPQGPRNKLYTAVERKKEMKWLKTLGVGGLKVDFFGGDKQETMRLYEDILSDANDYGLMIDFHGATLPRGWERMYPNYVGSEAVVASEMLIFSQGVREKEAYNAALHPFIRNTVGCMEFGGVLLNKYLVRSNEGRNQRLTTDAFQLATAILYQNPVQMFGLTPNNLTDVPGFEIDLMKEVPTTWDETVFVDGYPGKYCVIARRHGDRWYVAGVNAMKEPVRLRLKLPMLAGKKGRLYGDDEKGVSYRKEFAVKGKRRSMFNRTEVLYWRSKSKFIQMTKFFCFAAAVMLCGAYCFAQNPLIHDQYTADPSARVFGDSIYVYPSHDIHWAPGKGRPNWFCMEDYHVFSSPDGVSWTDHGMVVSQKTVPWVDSGSYSMWAPDCMFRNGKYYLYFPSPPKDTTGRRRFAIGVAVGDHPGGPFVPEQEPIKGVAGIDPNVFIDKDGQAYLYWAQGNLYVARLRADMLGLASEPVVLSQLPAKGLKEGPWVFERKGIYYLTYPHVENKTERLEYAVGSSPMGPFQFKGVIMDESPTGCWTNHHSILSFKGQWYLFYHHNDLSPDFDKNRSIRADSLFFEADGSIRKVEPTLRGIGLTPAGRSIQLDRYSGISGGRIAFLDSMERMKGWKVIFDAPGAWVQYNSVDFGRTTWRSLVAKVMSSAGGSVEVRVDGMSGPIVGRLEVPAGGDWRVVSVPLRGKLSGVKHLFVVGGEAGVQVDWIRFDSTSGSHVARNPVIDADVPDMSIIRVGDVYYMSSTTMHMSPGVPIMKSTDLVNWKMVSYAYDALDDVDELDLNNGKSAYGRGSWASCLRFHNGQYYVSTFSGTTGKTYVYSTSDIEKGPWKRVSFKPSLHDHSLFFDDDGKAYMVFGGGRIMLAELKDDLSGIREGTKPQPIIDNASVVAGSNVGLPAEGSQLFKINGKYYLFNITWPKGGMRTVVIHRADQLAGPWEGRVALQDKGVAQGGLVNTPNGEWYAYLFRDYGSVGRVPYLAPVSWRDGWPVLGVDGKVPDSLELPGSLGLDREIVASDEFARGAGERPLPLVWQWNHNPDDRYWSVSARPGWLRLTAGRVDTSVLSARNTLTQRTVGPTCWGSTAIDISHMRDGDRAGLLLLQRKYGWVGVKMSGGERSIVMVDEGVEKELAPVRKDMVYLKADCDFADRTDKARFYYSLDGKKWTAIGTVLQMAYTLPHFMGYRFGLFNYATKEAGGYVDFDHFRVGYPEGL